MRNVHGYVNAKCKVYFANEETFEILFGDGSSLGGALEKRPRAAAQTNSAIFGKHAANVIVCACLTLISPVN